MQNREDFGLQCASQHVGLQNNKQVLFIDKNNVLPSQWVRSIAGQCAQAQVYVRLSTLNYS